MNFIELEYKGNIIRNTKTILDILEKEKFYWLIDSEVDSAKIRLLNNTIIWEGGDYLFGDWYYGIFRNGNFYGKWINGIFDGGNFKGQWISGINTKNNTL